MRSGVAQVSRTATKATREVARVVREQVRVVTWKLGMTRQATEAPPKLMTFGKPPAVTVPGPDGAAAQGSLPAPQPVAGALPPQPPLTDPSRAAEIAQSRAVGQVSSAPVQADELVETATTVYSAADPLVVPPELIRPSRSTSPPAGVRIAGLAEVELVISTTGEVESVKLLSPGTGPQPGMMLSAVKSWIFQPATRGGHPVKYRHRMRLLSK